MTDPIIRLEHLSKSYATRLETTTVLDGVDLTLWPGDKASLIGPSGSGKSTLLSMMAGLLTPDSGEVEVDGIALGRLDDRGRARLRAERIGVALQADNLIPFLTAQENVELAVAFGPAAKRRAAPRRAKELLARFGVADRADHRPRHLSGGEAQRVALAVSMANDPALLLADEVVAQLDGQTAATVVDEVLDGDFAVLFVTHDIAIADLADRRFALEAMNVVER